MSGDETNDWVEMPIDGILDLHQFQPREIHAVVEAYIEACIHRRLKVMRIIHGKGIGQQRELVHKILQSCPAVHSYRLDTGAGSWGATLVDLILPDSATDEV